jgi:hypothetical protein
MADPITLANNFVGTYAVDGRTHDGAMYKGTLRFERKGRFLHAEANLSSLGTRYGLAMPYAGRLVMAYGPKDKVEIGAYTADGTQLRGVWIPPGAATDDLTGCGRENSVSTGTGIWLINDAVAIDGNAYSGSLAITQKPDDDEDPCPVTLDWKLHDGEYHSFGLQFRHTIYTTFSFEPDKPHGIIVYDVSESTSSLVGSVLSNESMIAGRETMTRQAGSGIT